LKPVQKRKLVDEMRGEWGVSIRRTCRVFEVDTSTYRCKSRRPGQAALEQRIQEICQTRARYGYRPIHVLLRREGWRDAR
jgi:putative transposase